MASEQKTEGAQSGVGVVMGDPTGVQLRADGGWSSSRKGEDRGGEETSLSKRGWQGD